MRLRVGWRVHGWAYPVVWWARRKPDSRFRQWLWNRTDAIQWWSAMRHYRKIQKMTTEELRAHIAHKWGGK